MTTPEGELVKAALDYLQLRGVYAWRNNTGAYKPEGSDRYVRYGYRGSSDILGVTMDGRIVCVECKAQFGTVSTYQRAFLDEVRTRGGIALVVRPADYSRVIDEALGAL